MNESKFLKSLGIKVPKEAIECEIVFKVQLDEKENVETEICINGSTPALKSALLTIIKILMDKGLYKDIAEIKNDYVRFINKKGKEINL